MSSTSPSSSNHHPLEGDPVERALAISVEGRTVTGIARANWGAVEVAITSPITNLTRGQDGRGWCFAMLAHHRPQERYALGGELTAKGLQAAERFLEDLYLDWLAVARHEAAVDAACRRARQELADLLRTFEERSQPARKERLALRRLFKAGELTQRAYQFRLQGLRKDLDEIGQERWRAEEAVRARFAVGLEGLCGRRVALDEAEKLLSEAAIVM